MKERKETGCGLYLFGGFLIVATQFTPVGKWLQSPLLLEVVLGIIVLLWIAALMLTWSGIKKKLLEIKKDLFE